MPRSTPHTTPPARKGRRGHVSPAWLLLSAVVLVGGVARLIRVAYRHFRDSPDCQSTVAWFAGSGGLWGLFSHLAQSGLTWQSGGAFFGGLGTFLMGVTSLMREVRLHGDSKQPTTPEA